MREPGATELRRMPVLLLATLRLVREAAPRELIVAASLSLISAVGLLGELLLGRVLLRDILRAHATNGGVGSVLPVIVGLVALTTMLGLIASASSSAQQLLGALTTRLAQRRVLEVAVAIDLASFESPAFHDALSRAQMGVPRISSLTGALTGMIRSVFAAVGATVALLFLNPMLIVFAAVAAAPLVLISSRRNRLMYGFHLRMTTGERERNYLGSVMTSRPAAGELRAYGVAPFLRARYDRRYDEYIDGLRAVTKRMLIMSAAADAVAGVILAAGLAGAIAISLSEHIGLAAGATSAVAMFALGQRLLSTTNSAGGLIQSAMFIQDYMRLAAWNVPEPPATIHMSVPVTAAASVGVAVAAEDVIFSYPSSPAPVLNGVSVRIAVGEVIAVVGANGSGKSTLAKLLAGLYEPTTGSVHFDGVDLRELHPAQVRASVAPIFQDFVRYALPVRDNIAVGRHEAAWDITAIRAAATDAGAHAFVDALADGYDTRLGPEFFGGTEISGGQWQRIALARMLFRDAPFVILDEPTSALDAETEHALFTDMRTLFAGRTVLLISHRFSTVKDADRILVMQDGRIIEQGDHDELLVQDGVYAQLFNLQAGAYL